MLLHVQWLHRTDRNSWEATKKTRQETFSRYLLPKPTSLSQNYSHFPQPELFSRKGAQGWRGISPASVHMHLSFSLFGTKEPCMLGTPDWSGLCMKHHSQRRGSRALRGNACCQQEQQKQKSRFWLRLFGCHSSVLEKERELAASTSEEGMAPSTIREKIRRIPLAAPTGMGKPHTRFGSSHINCTLPKMQPQWASSNVHPSGKCRVWLPISDLILFKMDKLGHKLWESSLSFTSSIVCLPWFVNKSTRKYLDGMEHLKALQPSSWNTMPGPLEHLGSLVLGNVHRTNFVLQSSVYSSRVAFLMKALWSHHCQVLKAELPK